MGFTEHLVNPPINFSTKTVVVFLFHALKCSITLIHLGTDHKTDHKTFTPPHGCGGVTCKYKTHSTNTQKKEKKSGVNINTPLVPEIPV